MRMISSVVVMLLIGSASSPWCVADDPGSDDSVIVLPGSFTLTGPEARQTLLVERLQDGETVGQVTEGVRLRSQNPGVVRIENGVAVPAGNGTATITAEVNGRSAEAQVTVEQFDRPHQWSFRNHVQSVLTKTGCNSGACHGAAAGKNGFRLSLRGYDPEFDHLSITRQSRGRRIVPSDPGRSLLLTKPSGAVPHKGGLRFEVDSPEYRALAGWIATGQIPPRDDDPRLERLEVLPAQATLQPGQKQQVVVRAHFTDGHSEDVTRWAKFTSTNQAVAKVSDEGLVEVSGHGEGAIVAWYLANNVVATITSPFENPPVASGDQSTAKKNLIDRLVMQKLRRLNLPASPSASDSVFLRRAYLDTLGILPTPEETRNFLADTAPDKRARLIDALLERPEFVDYWTYQWSDLLLLSGKRLRPKALKSFSDWIREQVKENTPWDEFARQVVTATGSTYENGAANFYALHQDPPDMAETVSMAFMGMSIQCAKCHDHPLEKWTNDQYYAMANLFSRVRGKGWGGDFRNGDGNRTIFIVDRGELIQPRTGKPQQPAPLDGEPVAFDSPIDRRIAVAEWLTSLENPWFAKAIVNRVWANFLGVGIVERVDDLRLTNPPSNAALLDGLAEYLVQNDYDLKALMRLILNSQTYQRSSESLPGNVADTRFYSRYYPRRLSAEVLLDAMSLATAAPTQFKDYPAGTRALELRDANVTSYFLETFGRPERLITCECERSDEPSMVQVLHIVNGDTLNEKLSRKADEKAKTTANRIGELLESGVSDEQIIETAYLAALSRFPTDSERAELGKVLAAAGESNDSSARRQAVEDLFWSILSSKEFLFLH